MRGVLKFLLIFAAFFLFGMGGFYCYKARFPTVSVVLPVYNRADLLPHAIDFILAQSFGDFELIVVDDGSDEDTKRVIRTYVKKDRRIRVITNPKNCGIACSRNRGNEAARGKYIAVMDSDDMAMPYRLQQEVAFLNDHPEIDVVGGGSTSLKKRDGSVGYEHLEQKYEPYKVYIENDSMLVNMMFYNPISNSSSCYRRAFIERHRIRYDESLMAASDYDFWKQIAIAGGKFSFLGNTLVAIRQHGTNGAAYYKATRENSFKIKHELISRFYDIPFDKIKMWFSRKEKCEIMWQVRESNSDKKIFRPEAIESFLRMNCNTWDTARVIEVRHPLWQDQMKVDLDMQRAFLVGQESFGDILSFKEKDHFKVKWDLSETQMFIYDPQTGLYHVHVGWMN